MKLKKAHQDFILWLATTRDLSSHTVRAYGSDIASFAKFVGVDAPINDVTGEAIASFVEEQRTGRLSPATLRRRIAALRSFCKWLVLTNGLAVDPWSQLSLQVRKPKSLPRAVPASYLSGLLAHLRREAAIPRGKAVRGPLGRPHEATTFLAVALMISTGLRVSEVVGIRCSDIDVIGGQVCVKGKGSRERTVFLASQWLRDLVEAYLKTRAEVGIIHPFLLFNRSGAPLTTASMRTRLAKAARLASPQRHITPHMLRHSAATQLLEAGVDIRYVQRLLGHASLTTTEIYTHVSDVALHRVLASADVLGRCLNSR